MKRLKLALMLISMISLTSMTGCSLIKEHDQPVYIPAGAVAEVAALTRVECWITNKDTGNKERRFIEAQPGYYVGRPRVDEIGKIPAKPAELSCPIPLMPELPENQKLSK